MGVGWGLVCRLICRGLLRGEFCCVELWGLGKGKRLCMGFREFGGLMSISRIPVATNISNVIGRIEGSDGSGRVYVISGHYDSRVTDVLNGVDDAPGANDDASGVAGRFPLPLSYWEESWLTDRNSDDGTCQDFINDETESDDYLYGCGE